jgi:pimeloyl-ACP methyl ester carboxylesterase
VTIEQRSAEVAGTETFWHEAEPKTKSPVLYVHGVPTNADDWLPFMEKTGGYAPDLPGFGRSAKPAHFEYSITGYADFLEAFLDANGIDSFRLLVHDWGGVGIELAMRRPDKVERLVAMNCVPFLPGYRWHRIARAWRTPLIGEMLMGFTFKWNLSRSIRAQTAGEPPQEWLDSIWQHFDHGTQRAILKLYRSAPPDLMARLGDRLDQITAPALIAWGDGDSYIPPKFADMYGEALGGETRVEHLEGVPHWTWVGRPATVDLVTEFLLG